MVSNDAQKLQLAGRYAMFLMSAPLEFIGACSIVWYLVGWQGLVGVVFMVLVVLYNVAMSDFGGKLRKKMALVTDQRLSVMSEIISGIRAVKMYAWEGNYTGLVNTIRR